MRPSTARIATPAAIAAISLVLEEMRMIAEVESAIARRS